MKFVWLILLLIVLQFGHYPFSADIAWEVGWVIQDFTSIILLMCWYVYVPYKEAKLKTSILFLLVVFLATALINLSDFLAFRNTPFDVFFILSSIGFVLVLKQLSSFERPKESDSYVKDRYMYGLYPINTWLGALNFMRPLNCTQYGGRFVTANGQIWRVKGGKFVKQEFVSVPEDTILLDTGVQHSKEIDDKLNKLVGQPVKPFFFDCAELDVGVRIEDILHQRREK